jgi:hypothetical protein
MTDNTELVALLAKVRETQFGERWQGLSVRLRNAAVNELPRLLAESAERDRLAKECERLRVLVRVLVQSAYYEGWEDAQDACSANVLFNSNSLDGWEISAARKALEPHND